LVVKPASAEPITVGSSPKGMREVTALAGPLSRDKKTAVSVNFTTQPDASVGFFFKVDDIEPGKIWVDPNKNLSAEEFQTKIRDVCRT
jgi:hypothetical protein